MNFTRGFPKAVTSIKDARRFVLDVLADVPRDVRDTTVLLISELATNSIRHAESAFEVSVTVDDQQVRIEVNDSSSAPPRPRNPGPHDLAGRGILIVERLADRWGFEEHRVGKTVWFVIDFATAEDHDGSTRSSTTDGESGRHSARRDLPSRAARPQRRARRPPQACVGQRSRPAVRIS